MSLKRRGLFGKLSSFVIVLLIGKKTVALDYLSAMETKALDPIQEHIKQELQKSHLYAIEDKESIQTGQ